MNSHVEEVRETLDQCRAHYREQIEEAGKTIAESAKGHYADLAKYALACLDDILDSAIERQERLASHAITCKKCTAELAEFDLYLQSDLSRTIEFCEILTAKFLRLWEGLQ